MARGARILVETCAAVKPREKVLVVADFNKQSIAEAVASAAVAAGAEVVITFMEPAATNGMEPAHVVAAAMRVADVIFAPTTYSLAHTLARVNACKAGARMVNLPGFTEGMLVSGGIDVDFEKQKPIIERVAALLTKANKAQVKTAKGTDIVMSVEGRRGDALTGLCHLPGTFSPVPDLEARVTPVEGTARGTIVVDGSIPIQEVGVLSDPVVVEVDKGQVTEIKGGRAADSFRRVLEAARDTSVFNIAELGIGMNPKARLIGTYLEDEGTMGTVHIAVGTSGAFGGKVRAPLHIDMIIKGASVLLDDELIMESGELKV